MAEQGQDPGRWKFDHQITISHVMAVGAFLILLAGGWYQLQQIDGVLSQQVQVSQRHSERIADNQQRVMVLESQRRETNRRLDEIRDDVRFIRDRLERQEQ